MKELNSQTLSHADKRARAQYLCEQINLAHQNPYLDKVAEFKKLFKYFGENCRIESGFWCDYGSNITFGDGSFLNYGCIFLDIGEINIGKKVQFGPGVHIYTVTHPLDHKKRADFEMLIAPVNIGDYCWIGGNSVIMPGVTIGPRTVIGAGSIVTKDIPGDVLAFGNPCRVIKSI